MIELKHLGKIYSSASGSVEALKDVNLTIADGEIFGIIGLSGAGKSTLVRCINLLERPTSGTVTRPKNIGFVFQQYHLMPELTVLENVLLPTMSRHFRETLPKGAATFLSPHGLAQHLLEKVGLQDRMKHLPSELSGGEMQRVALARALVTSPELVLADEPTGNLDAWTGAGILKILTELSSDTAQKFALVMVTHSPEAAAICDRVLTLEDGLLK